MTWDGSGTNPSDFGEQLVIDLASLYSATNPVGHLYIDLSSLDPSSTQITGTAEYVYPITAANFVMNDIEPESVDYSVYIYIGSFVSSGGVWSDTGWFSAPTRSLPLPIKFVSPIVYTLPNTVVGSVGSVNQISQGHVLDIDSFPGAVSNLSWWSLSANEDDGSGNGRDLSDGAVPSYGTPGLFGTDNAANLTNNIISDTSTFFRRSNNLTQILAAGWFKFADWSNGSVQDIMTIGSPLTDVCFSALVETDGSISAYASTSSATVYDKVLTIANPSFANASWHHVAFLFVSNVGTDEIRIYLDGRLSGSLACPTLRVPTTGFFYIGGYTTSISAREVAVETGVNIIDEDVRRIAAYRIDHNRNIPNISQRWEASRVRADGDVAEEMGDSGWMVDKSNSNRLYLDLSDVDPLDSVNLKLLDESGQAVSILPTKTFDSGWMQSQPIADLSHNLPDVPASVVLLYEATTGEYSSLKIDDYVSWDSSTLYLDLTAFGLLTIDSSHKWRIIASLGASVIGLAAASLSQAGLVSVTDQHFNGNKWLNGNFYPEADNTYDLGSTSLRWKTVHVGPGSLIVHGDNTDTKKLTLSFSGSEGRIGIDSASSLNFLNGSTETGSVNNSGLWTLGPNGGGVTHLIRGDLSFADGTLYLGQIATPSTPGAGYNRIYPKTDGKIYNLNSAGEEKVVGGGLIVTADDHTIAGDTLESGRHYVIDMSGAAASPGGDIAVNLPAGAAESIIRVSVIGNSVNGAKVTFNAAGIDGIYAIYYDGASDSSCKLENIESWIQFMWDSIGTPRWVVDDASTPTLIDFAGDVTIGGILSISNDSNHAWGTTYKGLQLGPNGNAMYSVNLGVNSYIGLLGNCYHDGAYKYISADEASLYFQYAGKHTFYTAAAGSAGGTIGWTTALVIDNDGNVGINTSSPTTELQVVGTLNATVGDFGGSGSGVHRLYATVSTSWNKSDYMCRFINNETQTTYGNVLHLTGAGGADGNGTASSNLILMETVGGTDRFRVDGLGQTYATSTTISSISDIRLKDNVERITGSLQRILSLEPSRWIWKEDNGGETTGFIAQELQLIYPEFVKEGMDGYLNVGASGTPMIAELVKAIQEQQVIIESLKTRIETLENN